VPAVLCEKLAAVQQACEYDHMCLAIDSLPLLMLLPDPPKYCMLQGMHAAGIFSVRRPSCCSNENISKNEKISRKQYRR
jgi:hypothetical protein